MGIKSEYTGESGRSMYQRGSEHLKNLKDRAEDSPLWKHCAGYHEGEVQGFQMKLLQRHKTAFDRQISESVAISNGKRDQILNSKSEWMGEALPRLAIEVRNKVRQVDYDGHALIHKPTELP